jgi:small subunit ribosomal protein S11
MATNVSGTKSVQQRKKIKKQIIEGVIHIKASFNNTKITATDMQGNVVAWSSSAKAGFRGSRKSTPFSAQVASDALTKDCIERFGMKRAHVKVSGPGPGRESAVRALETAGLKVSSIEDVTGIPHNGCRDPKKRRT